MRTLAARRVSFEGERRKKKSSFNISVDFNLFLFSSSSCFDFFGENLKSFRLWIIPHGHRFSYAPLTTMLHAFIYVPKLRGGWNCSLSRLIVSLIFRFCYEIFATFLHTENCLQSRQKIVIGRLGSDRVIVECRKIDWRDKNCLFTLTSRVLDLLLFQSECLQKSLLEPETVVARLFVKLFLWYVSLALP